MLVISDRGSQHDDKCWVESSECSISRCLGWPSFVTLITPGIIITSHTPVLTALIQSPMNKFKRSFSCNVQAFLGHLGNEEMQRTIKRSIREITVLFCPDITPRTGTTRWTCGWWSATRRTNTSLWSSPPTRSVLQ